MDKSGIAVIAAAVLFVALVCTACCVGISDEITGTYMMTGDDSSVTFVVFEKDGSGYFTEAAASEGAAGMAAVSFSWTAAEPKKTYTLTFADGTTKTALLNTERGILTIDGVEYQEALDKFSGSTTQKAPVTQEVPEKMTGKYVDDVEYGGKNRKR